MEFKGEHSPVREYLGESYDYSDEPTSPVWKLVIPEKFYFALPYGLETDV